MDNEKRYEKWDKVITPPSGFFSLNFRELIAYVDLLLLLIKRDFSVAYKQTVLGPLWFIIQPLMTSTVFTIIFSKVAEIPTDGIPPFLFYLAGNVLWILFSSTLTATSSTFVTNNAIFKKVYFPRLIVPLATSISGMFKSLVQFGLFLTVYAYVSFQSGAIHMSFDIVYVPLLILQLVILSMSCGLVLSSLTVKYRDLQFALGFFLQLWMYASPIVYPLSQVPERYEIFYQLNPVVAVVEEFRHAFFSTGAPSAEGFVASIGITLLLFITGLLLFNRAEKTVIDTV